MTHDEAVRKFTQACGAGRHLFALKNKQYGNAITKTGVLGAVVELIGACARLPQMVLKAPDHGRSAKSKLFDVLLDIHNYANIALLMLDSDNWEGE